MGAVYEATQLSVGRRVAIKVLNSALKTNSEVRERFRLEAQAIASLNHPNCITLFDFGYSDRLSALFMVVEYLEGVSLEHYLVEGLDTELALRFARQVADVCALAHEAGVLHRDLKPENIMVVDDPSGEPAVKVLDFGLARIFDAAASDSRLTRQGQIFGTPAYMSPEQCGGELEMTAAVDVYALGVTLYEMLAGRLPFESTKVPELLVMHTRQSPPPLERADLSPDVIALVEQMLSKAPADRPSAREVAARLRQHAARDRDRTPAKHDVPATHAITSDDAEARDNTPSLTETAAGLSCGPGTNQRIVLTAVVFCCVGVVGAVALLVSLDQQQGPLSRASATPGAEKTVYQPTPSATSTTRQVVETAEPASLAGDAAVAVSERAVDVAAGASARGTGEPTPPNDARPNDTAPGTEKDTDDQETRGKPKLRKPKKDKRLKKFRKLEFNY